MKRVLFILLVVLCAALVYGQEQTNSLDFGLGGIISVSDDMVGFGPGVAVDWYNTKLFGSIGLGAYLNAVFPHVPDDMGDKWGAALSMLVGPSYMIYDNGLFALPVTAGVHFDWVMSFSRNVSKINLGAGAVFDFVWRFGQKWHAYARVMPVYNFGAGGEFLVFPGLGAGFSF